MRNDLPLYPHATVLKPAECGAHFRVQRNGGPIQQNQSRVAQKSPGQGNSLVLTAGKVHPPIAQTVSKPSGRVITKSKALATQRTFQTSESLASLFAH